MDEILCPISSNDHHGSHWVSNSDMVRFWGFYCVCVCGRGAVILESRDIFIIESLARFVKNQLDSILF
jgi:hypothetical protein